MKRLKTILVVLVACLFVTGCSCSKKESYTVTFDTAGGTTISSVTVEDGNVVTKPANPTKEGYTFAGWYYGDTEYDFSKAVNGNITITARWTEDTTPVSGEKVAVTSVTASKSSISLTVGDTEKLSITVKPNNATDKKVTYKSSDTKVATVSSNGTVTAKTAGSATITATADGKSTTIKVTVTEAKSTNSGTKTNSDSGSSSDSTPTTPSTPETPTTIAVTGVSLNKTALTLTVGGNETITATVAPSDATNKTVTWSSSNSSVAKVENGKITAVASGTATITVTTADGSKTATATVTVKDKAYTYSIGSCPSDSGYDAFKCATVYYGDEKLTLVSGDKLKIGTSTARKTVVSGMITIDDENITEFYNSKTGQWYPITKR